MILIFTFRNLFPSLTLSTTNTTITMTWTLPSFAPQTYQVYYQCRRQCEQSFSPTMVFNSISSPYTFTGIDPGTYCLVSLNGIYGIETVGPGTRITITLSSGKLLHYHILNYHFFLHYLQYPHLLSVISLSRQLRQGP